MFALAIDVETRFLQRFDRALMIYAGKLRHQLWRHDFHFANFTSCVRFAINFQIFSDCIPNIAESVLDIHALRMAAGQFRTTDGNSFLILNQRHVKFSLHETSVRFARKAVNCLALLRGCDCQPVLPIFFCTFPAPTRSTTPSRSG